MSPDVYPIRVVAQLTGINIHTLRAWERRYQAVVPDRGPRGQRIYRASHITRLRALDALVRGGHDIGKIAALTDAALSKLADRGNNPPPHQPPPRSTPDLAPLLLALDTFDLLTLESELSRFSRTMAAAEFVATVAMPLLRELGERWQAGTLRTSQEHTVSAVVRSVLGGLLHTAPRPTRRMPVLFATVAGEHHELGLLGAAVLCAHSGFKAIYLGPDVPVEDIASAAKTLHVKAIVLAATVVDPTTAAMQIARLAKGIQIVVGGRPLDRRVRRSPQLRHLGSIDELVPALDGARAG